MRRRSLKGLQKAPWKETKEPALSSSSESESKQLKTGGKIKSDRKGNYTINSQLLF